MEEKIKGIIYRYWIINDNGILCRYTGQTIQETVEDRALNGKGYKNSPRFFNYINKYGWDNFTIEILKEGYYTQEQLDNYEIFYIKEDKDNSDIFSLNLDEGGHNGSPCDETCNQIGETLKQKYATGEIVVWSKGLTKEDHESIKISAEKRAKTLKQKYDNCEIEPWNKGLTKEDNESLKIVSENFTGEGNPMYDKVPWNKGVPHTEEAKQKMSDNTDHNLEKNPRWNKDYVMLLSYAKNILKLPTQKACAQYFNLKHKHIKENLAKRNLTWSDL